MLVKIFKKYWLHFLLWGGMFAYFMVAPDLYTSLFIQNGKPLQTQASLPPSSDRISFGVDDLVPYTQDGERLMNLYGWAFIVLDRGEIASAYAREIVLSTNDRIYFFTIQSVYRNPAPQSLFRELDVDLNNLGYSALIEENVIKPGKYRIGIIFRNNSTGSAFYWDKPARYLVKTPNTIRLEKSK